MKRFLLFAVLTAMATASGAVDFDKLKKFEERIKDATGQSSPPPKEPDTAKSPDKSPDKSPAATTQAPSSPPLPSIPPIGNVPEADEIKIGQHIAGNLLGAAPLVKSPALQVYVNRVGRWVASNSERPNLKWTFGVIDSNDVNAFAAPGGYVFITRGLYSLLRDEAELAGVLGHEIAHVVKKHHLKVLQKSQAIDLGSKVLKKQMGDDKIAQKLVGSGAQILARGLDKEAEFEADRMGVVLAARAGYDPFGLPAVLQEISAASANSSAVALLFKTHPHPDERLARLGTAMGGRFDALKNSKSPEERLVALPAGK
ncbi:MAG: M48 family metalloprotease [Betaproteobacteria bacterium]